MAYDIIGDIHGSSRTLMALLLGHYWLEEEPEPLASNIACLDFSVAKRGGKLVAYRWDGERELSRDRFVSVDRIARDGINSKRQSTGCNPYNE